MEDALTWLTDDTDPHKQKIRPSNTILGKHDGSSREDPVNYEVLNTQIIENLPNWNYLSLTQHPNVQHLLLQEFLAEVTRHGFTSSAPSIREQIQEHIDAVLSDAVLSDASVSGPETTAFSRICQTVFEERSAKIGKTVRVILKKMDCDNILEVELHGIGPRDAGWCSSPSCDLLVVEKGGQFYATDFVKFKDILTKLQETDPAKKESTDTDSKSVLKYLPPNSQTPHRQLAFYRIDLSKMYKLF